MLPHPTHDRLIALGLVGMAKAFEEQRAQPAVTSLTFEERLGLLVDREAVERESKRPGTRRLTLCTPPQEPRPCRASYPRRMGAGPAAPAAPPPTPRQRERPPRHA